MTAAETRKAKMKLLNEASFYNYNVIYTSDDDGQRVVHYVC